MKNNNRIGIITGASSGIGRSVALRLASNETNLILNGRNKDQLISLKNEIIQKVGYDRVELVVGDVKEMSTMNDCIDKCFEKWNSHPNLFIASAGRGLPGTLLTSKEEEWKSLIDTNIIGLMNQLKAISKSMIEAQEANKGSDSIINDIVVIGSNIGRNVSPFNSVYGATKFATHGMTEALRRELGPKEIRVSLIEPGIVETNFQNTAGYDMEWFNSYLNDIGPALSGDDIAKAIEFIINLPKNVHIDNISIRTTRQTYP